MKILLDQPLNGMKMYLESYGYEIVTAYEKKMTQAADDDLVKASIKEDSIFVTNDNKAAKLARMHGAKLIHIDMAFLAKVIHNELSK